jgi:hypothetical protein
MVLDPSVIVLGSASAEAIRHSEAIVAASSFIRISLSQVFAAASALHTIFAALPISRGSADARLMATLRQF